MFEKSHRRVTANAGFVLWNRPILHSHVSAKHFESTLQGYESSEFGISVFDTTVSVSMVPSSIIWPGSAHSTRRVLLPKICDNGAFHENEWGFKRVLSEFIGFIL